MKKRITSEYLSESVLQETLELVFIPPPEKIKRKKLRKVQSCCFDCPHTAECATGKACVDHYNEIIRALGHSSSRLLKYTPRIPSVGLFNQINEL